MRRWCRSQSAFGNPNALAPNGKDHGGSNQLALEAAIAFRAESTGGVQKAKPKKQELAPAPEGINSDCPGVTLVKKAGHRAWTI